MVTKLPLLKIINSYISIKKPSSINKNYYYLFLKCFDDSAAFTACILKVKIKIIKNNTQKL